MLRYLPLPVLAAVAVTGVANAQGHKREDLLDALTRHIQICSEISDSRDRLSCYDKLQTQVGDVQPAAPGPTPLRPGQPPSQPPMVQAQGPQSGGRSPTPLAPPPMQTPGGGNATLGANQGQGTLVPPGTSDPDRAFDPNSPQAGYRPPEGMMPKPQPPVRRTGPRPIPNFPNPMPLVSLAASNLTYGEARYWQVTIAITSNTPRALDTQVQCTFLNGGRSVGEAYFGPTTIAPGEQISTELIGPPTTTFVDSTKCNVLSP
ncbi:MAG TPA: hypothetical protein VFB13_20060 [Reyranella sp.]|jgi:hypothetical protein|nr:hypothetical protein [Reyranella sp.]